MTDIPESLPQSIDVTVVIVTYNSERLVRGLLESLPDALAGCTHETVIVDNDSSDHTIDAVRAVTPAPRVVQMERNAGYAAAINAGLAAACRPARAALILNPDVRLLPGAIARMLPRLRDPGIGIVVPRLLAGDGALSLTLRREPTILRSLGDTVLGSTLAGRYDRWGETITRREAYLGPTRADWATGAVLLISTECLKACGAWDESFFLYSEETEFCLRAKRLGYRLTLEPKATATHLGGESRSSESLRALLVVNRIVLYRRDHSRPATAVFWAVAVLREVTRSLLGRPTSRAVLMTLLSAERMRNAQRRARERSGSL